MLYARCWILDIATQYEVRQAFLGRMLGYRTVSDRQVVAGELTGRISTGGGTTVCCCHSAVWENRAQSQLDPSYYDGSWRIHTIMIFDIR